MFNSDHGVACRHIQKGLTEGKKVNKETDSRDLHDRCFHSSCATPSDGDGSSSTQCNTEAGGRADEGDAAMDRMEFEGGGQVDAAC